MFALIVLIASFTLHEPPQPAIAITATGVERVEPTALDRVHYRAVLERIAIDDQKYRDMISWGTTDPEELAALEALDDEAHMAEWARRRAEGIKLDPEEDKRLRALQSELDFYITRVLINLVERFGWPSEEMLGEGTPDMTPVLIHMHNDDAGWVLPILRRETLAGRMDPKKYGGIYDRKLQLEGQPQLYGTVLYYDRATNSILPPEIVDIEATNAARAEIGLEPLTDYTPVEIDSATTGN